MILDDRFNIGIVHIGTEALEQSAAVDKFIAFMDTYYPLDCVYTQTRHPFLAPYMRSDSSGGECLWLHSAAYLNENLDMSKIPLNQQALLFLWECRGEKDDTVCWGGSAIGAWHDVAGAATASIPTNGCNVSWFDIPYSGFDYAGTQLMVHEIRNVVDWYYTMYYIPVGYPELPDLYPPVGSFDPSLGYCRQFDTLRDCYVNWYSLLGTVLADHAHTVDFSVPVGSTLTVDQKTVI
jgi:hypothetical protein